MKDLSYISTIARQGILEAYVGKYGLEQENIARLESQIFGYPKLRRLIEDGLDKANREVENDRYHQWTEPWFMEVVSVLPEPRDLDNYAGEDEESKAPVKKTIKDYISIPEGYKQYRDKVDEILLNFDFAKVHQVMELLNWEWASWEDEKSDIHYHEVPSEYALRKHAFKTLTDAVEKNYGGCGGFEVVCHVYDDIFDENGTPTEPDTPDDFTNSVHLELQFVVESWGRDY